MTCCIMFISCSYAVDCYPTLLQSDRIFGISGDGQLAGDYWLLLELHTGPVRGLRQRVMRFHLHFLRSAKQSKIGRGTVKLHL